MLGYIGKITKEEYRSMDHEIFMLDSYVGRSGLEKTFDDSLRGEDGGRQIEVNARGEQLRVLSEKEPVRGEDITLSVDLNLERAVVPFLGDKRVTVLMMDLKTGELPVFLSHPDFDPNLFVEGDKDEERIKLLRDQSRPLINRAISGTYPPGSVFKLVTALAGLETGKITRYTTFVCNGFFRLSPHSRRFKCWEPEGHGRMDLLSGLERSCNVYFYNVGHLVGEKELSHYAHELGLGEPLSLDIPAADGLIPSAEWKRSKYSSAWYGGETISFAIGQGYVLVTPLHILRLVAIVAKDGEVPVPTLIKTQPGARIPIFKTHAHKESFKAIKQGMLRVVESNFGTGQLARLDFMKVAAKTGTAQAPPEKPHAWFAGFFPYEDPQFALVVFVEHGGSGGLAAATIAKKVLEIWHRLDAPNSVFEKPALPPVSLEEGE